MVNAGDVKDPSSIPGLKDPLEKEMATHSNILAWRIPWTEEPGGLEENPRELDTTEATEHTHNDHQISCNSCLTFPCIG